MRRRPAQLDSESADPSPAFSAGEGPVWLMSDGPALVGSIQKLLADEKVPIVKMGLEAVEREEFRKIEGVPPALVLLDIDADLDRGYRIIRLLKRARLAAPMVVLVQTLSRDFGAKIVSEGIRYYFPHDFCKEELLALVHSLLDKPRE